MRRVWWFLLTFFVVLAGITLLAVFPARTYISQRHDLAAADERVKILSEQNKQLSTRVSKLHTDAEIERLARQQYDLVKPGEEAYAILPPPEADRPKTAATPAPKKHDGFWTRVGDTITFWN
jgi:cell division protein FtsB